MRTAISRWTIAALCMALVAGLGTTSPTWPATGAATADDDDRRSNEPTAVQHTEQTGDSNEDEEVDARVVVIDGSTALRLDEELRLRSGVALAELPRGTYQGVGNAWGRVVDLRELVDLRARYRQALGELAVAQARAANSRSMAERLRKLNTEQASVSAQRLRDAEAKLRVDEAQADERRIAAQSVKDQVIAAWGEPLAAIALQHDAPLFAELLAAKRVLLLVTLPPGAALPEGTRTVTLSVNNIDREPRPAVYLSAAPLTEAAAQGTTYFFHADARQLRVGMRLPVQVTDGGTAEAGVIVPEAAVVWHAGEPWVYVQRGDDLLVRVSIVTGKELESGWFVTDNVLRPGDRVVVRGGQMLLSEEFRWQIPREDDD